jgi:hypothetical protein
VRVLRTGRTYTGRRAGSLSAIALTERRLLVSRGETVFAARLPSR